MKIHEKIFVILFLIVLCLVIFVMILGSEGPSEIKVWFASGIVLFIVTLIAASWLRKKNMIKADSPVNPDRLSHPKFMAFLGLIMTISAIVRACEALK